MTQPTLPRSTCPYLGRTDDPDTFYLQIHAAHRCYATDPASRIDAEDQAAYCFGACQDCARFIPLQPDGRRTAPVVVAIAAGVPLEAEAAASPVPDRGRQAGEAVAGRVRRFSFEEWIVYGVTTLLVLVIGYVAFLSPARGDQGPPKSDPALQAAANAINATNTPTSTPRPAATPRETRAIDVLPAVTVQAPTAPAGGLVAAISPSERGAGSFNDKDRVPTFGQRNLLVGRYDDHNYLGGLLFPLNRIPPGAHIASVQLELAGLSDDQLAGTGQWTVEMLDAAAAQGWSNLTFETLRSATALPVKADWTLTNDALAPRKVNVLKFTPDALDAFAQRLKDGKVAFRIRGPQNNSADNLFAWDTGYGEGFGTRPVLRVGFVPPPPTPGPKPGEPTVLPLIVWVSEPTPAATTTPMPGKLPGLLNAMILFVSDRFGQTRLMVYDPAGNRYGQVTQPWVYVVGEARDGHVGTVGVSVEGRPCGGSAQDQSNDVLATEVPDPARRCTQLVVRGGPFPDAHEITESGWIHYDPAISPDGQWIAYVSNITGNDEIFKIKVDGTENTRLTNNKWEWDKHPSWSPDGSKIVFWSNRDGGRKQLFVMNADGSEQHNVSNSAFNDWDPVWVK